MQDMPTDCKEAYKAMTGAGILLKLESMNVRARLINLMATRAAGQSNAGLYSPASPQYVI